MRTPFPGKTKNLESRKKKPSPVKNALFCPSGGAVPIQTKRCTAWHSPSLAGERDLAASHPHGRTETLGFRLARPRLPARPHRPAGPRPEAVTVQQNLSAYHPKFLLSHLGSAHRCATGSKPFPGQPAEPEVVARGRKEETETGSRLPRGRQRW